MGLMEALAGWLKQIVAAVLLAALIDLLLPNRTMQRYVRLVAGLFILLTVSAPLLQWIRGDFSSKLAVGLNALDTSMPNSADEMSRIETEGRKLKEKRDEDAANLAAVRLQEMIRSDIEQTEEYAVSDVRIDVGREANGKMTVRQVAVTLQETVPASAEAGAEAPSAEEASADAAETRRSGTSPKIGGVQPVAPVTVDVPRVSESAAETSRNQAAAKEGLDGKASSRIAALLFAKYGIPADRVQVRMTERIAS